MRNLIGTWFRDGKPHRIISYQHIDNVLPKLTGHIVRKGKPGDVIEVTHRHNELLIGTITVKRSGLQADWVWDN